MQWYKNKVFPNVGLGSDLGLLCELADQIKSSSGSGFEFDERSRINLLKLRILSEITGRSFSKLKLLFFCRVSSLLLNKTTKMRNDKFRRAVISASVSQKPLSHTHHSHTSSYRNAFLGTHVTRLHSWDTDQILTRTQKPETTRSQKPSNLHECKAVMNVLKMSPESFKTHTQTKGE